MRLDKNLLGVPQPEVKHNNFGSMFSRVFTIV